MSCSNPNINSEILKEVYQLLLNCGVLNETVNSELVTKFEHPANLKNIIDFKLNENGINDIENILNLCKDVIKYSVKTSHTRFYNQLFGGVDPVGVAASWISDALSTTMATYEMAPVFTIMENEVIQTFCKLFGFYDGDGLMSPGGSISNMYGMILARYNSCPNVNKNGIFHNQPLIAFTSDNSHYSIKKSVQWLGIGTNNLILIKTDSLGRLLLDDLEEKINEALQQHQIPFFVNATCGTTVLGSFDNLTGVADICKKYNIWMHVDACYGGSIIFSKKYSYLLSGINRANSISWNAHKSLGVPLQCSFFFVHQKGLLHQCNSTGAQYIFQSDKFYDTSYDTGDKSVQCGRKVDIFKFWLMLKVRGFQTFEQLMDNAVDMAKYLTQEILKNPRKFRLICDETNQYTNVCFWYIPKSMRDQEESDEWWQKLYKICPMVKEKMMKSGSIMIGYSPLPMKNVGNFFRMVFSCYPPQTPHDVKFILDEIEHLAETGIF